MRALILKIESVIAVDDRITSTCFVTSLVCHNPKLPCNCQVGKSSQQLTGIVILLVQDYLTSQFRFRMSESCRIEYLSEKLFATSS